MKYSYIQHLKNTWVYMCVYRPTTTLFLCAIASTIMAVILANVLP